MAVKMNTLKRRGISIRKNAVGKETIQIQFQYRGVTCKHLISGLDPNKKADLRFACNLKSEIENKITLDKFIYSDYFPNAKRAKLFGHNLSNATIKKLALEYLGGVKRSYPHSTYKSYKKSCGNLITVFGNIRVVDLTALLIKDWIRSRNCSLKTITNDLIPLRAILDNAVNDEIIGRNPMDIIIVSKLVDRNSAASHYVISPFTEDEIKLIIKTAEAYHPQYRNILQFAFFSGLRTSELFGLMWKDIDWVTSTAYIQRAIVEKKIKTTKTQNSKRKVILLPSALDALNRQKQYSHSEGLYVFTRPYNRGHFIDYQHLHRPWNTILKRAGVEYRTQYQTRHTYASQLLSGGENLLFVANQMGHKTTEMIMWRYGRWVQQGQKNEVHTFVSDYGKNLD